MSGFFIRLKGLKLVVLPLLPQGTEELISVLEALPKKPSKSISVLI